MTVRSLPLLATALAMLAASGALASLLHHDGEVGLRGDVASSFPGEAIRFKGELEPFAVTPLRASDWAPLLPLLGNHTFGLQQADPLLVVLIAAGTPLEPGNTLVVEGEVRYRGAHPTDDDRILVIIHADAVTDPILFG